VVEELAAVRSSDRLHWVEEGVGFEPTEPLRPWKPRGSPDFKSGALGRSAIPPVFRFDRPARLTPERAFPLASALDYHIFVVPQATK
jgi:hypothetical protein